MREGSLDAPVRFPLGWQEPWFWDEAALEKEMERVFDICHGCRRCFNLCDSFPRLFDLIDNGPTDNNLKAAIAGETHEYTDMYPGMARTAREEGFGEIADWFETLAKAEKSHAGRFQKALDTMA